MERAFSGRLAPQDPADEPAAALLERVRRARENGGRGNDEKREEAVGRVGLWE